VFPYLTIDHKGMNAQPGLGGLAASPIYHRPRQREAGIHDGKMGQGLWEVAGKMAGRDVELFGQETNVVLDGQHAFKLDSRFLGFTQKVQAIGHPAGTGQECTFGILGPAVPGSPDKSAFRQFTPDGSDGTGHSRVPGGQETN
jgi:hypothetical protein